MSCYASWHSIAHTYVQKGKLEKAGDAKAFQTSNACTHVTEYVMRRACVRAVIIMQVTMKHKIKHQPKIGVVAVTK